ncbi:MAG TPA: TMEM175 family protein [Chloroflexota bacterium]|nr:TMEM175 family protein [Chloroflexota bacterium]
MSKSRTEAFSDGVFAVAITLLIFNVQVPPGGTSLRTALVAMWPSYVSYIVSFATIGIIWVNHHAVFRAVRRVDRPYLYLNLFLLMTVAFIPFPTALLGRALQAGHDANLAAAVYGMTMTLMSIGFSMLWAYMGFHPDLLSEALTSQQIRASWPRFSSGVLIYLGATALAFVSAVVSLIAYAAVALYYIFDQLQAPAEDEEATAIPEAEERL